MLTLQNLKDYVNKNGGKITILIEMCDATGEAVRTMAFYQDCLLPDKPTKKNSDTILFGYDSDDHKENRQSADDVLDRIRHDDWFDHPPRDNAGLALKDIVTGAFVFFKTMYVGQHKFSRARKECSVLVLSVFEQ